MLLDGSLRLKYKTYKIKSAELESWKGVCHLGGRKKQKDSFLPILSTLAKPVLLSAAESIGSKLLQRVGKKIFGSRKRRYRRKRRRLRYA